MSLTKVTYSMIYGAAKNVKDYGAVGNGSTDDTAALVAAAAALQNNESLYFPAGTYIVTTACVLFRGLSNITIFGDGASTILKPLVQSAAGSPTDYPSTLAIDDCTHVTLRDIVLESKGESWGNTDAYNAEASGLPRANVLVNKGGNALVVCRSDTVTCINVTSRRCGSVGVVYLSSCQNVVMQDCFANALSYGYAAFAADNWVDASIMPFRTYTFIDCRCSAENAGVGYYSGKSGIALEGDQIAGRALNVKVIGGNFEDVLCTPDAALYAGGAITALDTRLDVIGVKSQTCMAGVYWTKRGGNTNYVWLRINGCNFMSNSVTGVKVLIGNATGGSDVDIVGTTMTVDPTSTWAGNSTVIALAAPELLVSSGICTGSYMAGAVRIKGCSIRTPQYAVFSPDNSSIEITDTTAYSTLSGVMQYGGGSVKAIGNDLSVFGVTSSDNPIRLSSTNIGVTASGNINLYANGNILTTGADGSNLALGFVGSTIYRQNIVVKNNVVPMGTLERTTAATYLDLDPIMSIYVAKVVAIGLSGSDTYIEFSIPKEFDPVYSSTKGLDGVARTIIGQTNNYGGTRGLTRIIVAGDVRTQFVINTTAITLIA